LKIQIASSNPKPKGDSPVQFMMMVKHAENCPPPPKALSDAMAKLTEEAVRTGAFKTGGGLEQTAKSVRVKLSRGEVKVIDGPFTEAKEIVGGFAILEFPSKEEAIKGAVAFMELHKQHWPGWEGETEVRQIFGPPNVPSRP
jgi:hypothetical protein